MDPHIVQYHAARPALVETSHVRAARLPLDDHRDAVKLLAVLVKDVPARHVRPPRRKSGRTPRSAPPPPPAGSGPRSGAGGRSAPLRRHGRAPSKATTAGSR